MTFTKEKIENALDSIQGLISLLERNQAGLKKCNSDELVLESLQIEKNCLIALKNGIPNILRALQDRHNQLMLECIEIAETDIATNHTNEGEYLKLMNLVKHRKQRIDEICWDLFH